MNTQEQAYINGFIKRAIEAGLTEKQALDLAATQPVLDNPPRPINLALNPAQQQINAGGNYVNPVNFKMEDLAKDFQSKGRLNDLSKEILGRTPYPVSGGAGNYLMNTNKINQMSQNIKQSAERPGLWANIRAKRARGEKPAKPGSEDYPDKKQWSKLTKGAAESAAWQRSEGKNPEGGLNAKGRASYKAQTGGTLKAPVTENNPKGERAKRQNSFCSRMCGMKRVNTGSKAKSDPDSRINKALRKWNCKCGEAHSTIQEKIACVVKEARCWEGYEPVPGKKAYSDDSCRKKTPKKNMNTKQAFIDGFLKRAAAYGLTEKDVSDLLKSAEAPLPVAYGNTPANQAVRDAVMAPVNAASGAASGIGDYIKNNYRKFLGLDNPRVGGAGANQMFNKTLNRPAVKPQ
jgi:hypothetical protein